MLPEELDKTQNAEIVKWEKSEYVDLSVKNGKSVRKLELVKTETKAGELFEYLKTLLEAFPLHQHRAQWQNDQYKYITTNLPEERCVCMHDFRENSKILNAQKQNGVTFSLICSLLLKNLSFIFISYLSTALRPLQKQLRFQV